MKKSLICTALIILSFTSFSIAEEKVELLPEVQVLIIPKPLDPKLLENSFSIGLFGIPYPKDDYYDVAKQIIKTNYDILTGDLSKKLMLIEDQILAGQLMLDWSQNINDLLYDDLSFCDWYLAKNCVIETIQARDKIEKLLLDNEQFLQRYQNIVKNSDKYTDLFLWMRTLLSSSRPSIDFDTVDFAKNLFAGNFKINKFVTLTLHKVILQLQDQQMDEAIANLQQIHKSLELLSSGNEIVDLTNQYLAIELRFDLDLYLNAILDYGFLNDRLEQIDVMVLFQPYPDQHRYSIFYSYAVGIESDIVLNVVGVKNKQKVNNKGINQLYLFYQDYMNAVQNHMIETQIDQFQKECIILNEKYGEICSLGYIEDYLKRYDVQRNYHNLVYLKYIILKNNIKDKDIPNFLHSQGDLAIDSLTQEPFQWNAETRTIFMLLPEDKYLLPPRTQTVVTNNSEIKYLQVTIPQRDSK